MAKQIEIPDFEEKSELYDFLEEHKDTLIAQKKAMDKHGDGIVFPTSVIDEKGDVLKANEPVDVTNLTELKVRVIINTTNLMDSNNDVHIPKLWTRSLKENKMIMFLQEHRMAFDKIIADGADLKAFTKMFSWKDLGFEFEGDTQALVFEAVIKKNRNEFMFDQYAKGFVKNHSVGMRYVKIGLAINDEDRVAAHALWEKYIDSIANKKLAEEKGFFWAVTQAKVMEGSAVPLGSNFATPTLDNNLKNQQLQNTETKHEQLQNTHKEFYLEYLKHKS